MQTPPAARFLSRRAFFKSSALASGAAALALPSILSAANKTAAFKVAVIGLGGRGLSNLREVMSCGARVVAVGDADANAFPLALAAATNSKNRPRTYTDHLELLSNEKELDGVIIATPDHWHAPLVKAVMAAGKHVYCEKPLTHTIAETRELRNLARHSKVRTQLGNQGSADPHLRRAIELIQAGVIGAVREVHVWAAASGSFQTGQAKPSGRDPVPKGLDWDRWVGPASWHDYKKGIYHPKAWRAWYDFGGGSLADWGCHGLNLPYRALHLDYPVAIEADAEKPDAFCYPKGVRVRFEFAARGILPPVTLWWYDGGRLPPREVLPESVGNLPGEVPQAGVLIRGENGFTFGQPHPGANYLQLAGDARLEGILSHPATRHIPKTLPRTTNHLQEWMDAGRRGGETFSDFETGGKLTEIALSGLVALRTGKKLEWDGPGMQAFNAPEAEAFIHPKHRSGWK